MNCLRCDAENDTEARFCGQCGMRLRVACPGCGETVADGSNFCRSCGTAITNPVAPRYTAPRHLAGRILTSRAAVEGERKHVSVLFADVKASMELLAGRDPEDAQAILDPLLELMMEAVHHHEGTVNQVMGDGIMALFGAPIAHEDHAVRACLAALRMQESARRYGQDLLRRRGVPVHVRVGLNSGEVVVRSVGSDVQMDYSAVGQTTHVAARMEQIATPGSIFLSAATHVLAEGFVVAKSIGPVVVKGLTQPVPAYELMSVKADRSRFEVLVERGLTRFVGRDAQLQQLEQAFAEVASGHGVALAIAGEPGTGKSRLVWEFVRAHRTPSPRIVLSECESHAAATAYLPIAKLLRRLLQVEEGDQGPGGIRACVEQRLAAFALAPSQTLAPVLWLLGEQFDDAPWQRLDPPHRRRRVLETVTELLVQMSAAAPLVLAIDDLQWIDSESLDVLDLLVDRLQGRRILLLLSHRPGFEHRWPERGHVRMLEVDQLAQAAAAQMLDELMGRDASLRRLKRELIDRTGGNALFLEECVRSLAETGVLAGAAGDHHAQLHADGAQIPASVFAVLEARIDRLPEVDKRLLQTASVIGPQVPAALLKRIAEVSGAELRAALARLAHGGFLAAQLLDRATVYAFKHAITCEVAYQSLVMRRRHALHCDVVAAIEKSHPQLPLQDEVELLAHHALRGELWPKAVRYCAEAGRRAQERAANRAAVTHLENALDALAHLGQEREAIESAIDLRIDLRTAYGPLGEQKKMFEALREAERLALQLGDRRRLALAVSYQSNLLAMRGEFDSAVRQGRRALEIAEAIDDLPVRVVSSAILAITHWSRGEYRQAVARACSNVAVLGGTLQFERMGMAQLPAVYSRTSAAVSMAELGEFDEGLLLGAEALAIAERSAHPQSLLSACFGLGWALTQRGDFEAAIEVLERGLGVAEAADLGGAYLELVMPLATACALSGRVERALTVLDAAVARAMALKNRLGHLIRSGGRGEALLCAGRPSEALPLARLYLDITHSIGARGNEAWAMRLLGEVLTRQGGKDADEAGHVLGQAMTLARELEMRPLQARCQLALAGVQRESGAHGEAELNLAHSAAMFRDMGMPFWVARAEAEIQLLRGATVRT